MPALRLAETAGFYEALKVLTVPSPNAGLKVASVVDLLRHGGMRRLFGGVRAPSTVGTFLRTFTHGHVQQLDKINRDLLTGLATGPCPGLLTGKGGSELVFVDVDDTVREVHGYAKQAAAYGYSGVKGLNIQLATITSPHSAPVITGARLRRGNTASASGCGRLLTQAIRTTRAAGVDGRILARADSAYYGWAFVGAAIRARAWFSVTARMDPAVTAAIASISDDAWTPIEYPNAVYDQEQDIWISDAEVAEVPFTAFASRTKDEHMACRLIVRRVQRIQPLAGDGTAQGELFATYRHHAFITNSQLQLIEADQRHRDHAIIEQVIAELKNGPLAHLPSGKYTANAAWVACAVIAFNLARATAVASCMPLTRWATVRARIINLPARIATTGRRLIMHLPVRWPWTPAWEALWDTATATGPPPPATT